jgi:hypothetical protein
MNYCSSINSVFSSITENKRPSKFNYVTLQMDVCTASALSPCIETEMIFTCISLNIHRVKKGVFQIEAAEIGFYTYVVHTFRYNELFLRKSIDLVSIFM